MKNADAAAKREAERRARRLAANKLKREREARLERLYREKLERDRLRAARRKRAVSAIVRRLRNSPAGFDYKNYGALPRVELEVHGDRTSVLERFSREAIEVTELEECRGGMRFKIRKKDLRKAIAILEGMCYNFKVGESYGAGRFFAFWLSRIGLIVGTAAAAAFLYISYSYVWRLDISGNDRLSRAAIERVLFDNGYRAGVAKRLVDSDAVAAAINSLYGVSDAGAEIKGTTLYVYVLESDDYVQRGRYTAYESCYDATVTRIVIRSGTALVKRGDVVAKGDMLADGSVYSTAGEPMYVGDCDADIYGDVSVTFSAELGREVVEYVKTGRTARRTAIEVFGSRLFEPEPPFASYESAATTAHYDVLLPVYVTSYEYAETEPVTVELEPDAVAKAFCADKAKELEFIGDFNCTYAIKPTVSGLYRIDVFLSGEALISRGIAVCD